MVVVHIDEMIAELLAALAITRSDGIHFTPYKPGEVLWVRPGSVIEAHTRHAPGTLSALGSFSYCAAGDPSVINLSAGRYCSLAVGLQVAEGRHPLEAVTTSPWIYGPFYRSGAIPEDHVYRGPVPDFRQFDGPAVLGHDVWIGAHSLLRGGITIGHGAVVAAGSNVVKDVAPYTIVGGNPARMIRPRFPEDLAARLLDSAWWDICPTVLRDLDLSDPLRFLDALDTLRVKGPLPAFTPGQVQVTQTGEFALL